ncbi:hypothetical protein GLOTRDRAFT_135844 [Gloeophyllum trabeum ATCC 11539]|uniref:Uncharacterized protein n=1 Tax=Gloeophyllum trabeum (strain ATCC 11539 / FP-39264 / Madison 617) TaxID=670483 RepID=S7QPC4_GLOTA|nr:uncharacterized protein GLOTRDRAFT_135844 [Gloeophyllum trabeum ATCC 11539]EPQ61378.1 hypothetical protein GLOTRDRAFT_135844 [Gloeophyllum trabeum ATCC 11539]
MEARPPPPPPGTNYLQTIQAEVDNVLVAHTFTVLYVPLFIALLWFSTPRSRRQVSFVLNVISILLAFSVGVVIDIYAVTSLTNPTKPLSASWTIAIGVLGIFQSILVDTILLARLFVVYPWRITSNPRRLLIFGLPIALKLARIANLIVYIKLLADAASRHQSIELLITAPYLKVEWFLQLADNLFASVAFLAKLRPHIRGGSLGRKLKTLFYIAVSNFVIPVIFSLVQIIFLYRSKDYQALNSIICVNTSVAVIGVVFATVWAGVERHGADTRAHDHGDLDTEADAYKQNIIKMMHMQESTVHDPSGTQTTTTTYAVMRPGPESIGRSPIPPGREKRYQRPVTPEVPIFFITESGDKIPF